jgi:hypothetical protein
MTDEQKQIILEGIDKALLEETPLLDRARQSNALHQHFFSELKLVLPDSNFDDFQELIAINDFHAFTSYSLLDLYVTVKNLVTAKTDWERIYFVKHGYLIIHASLETFYAHNTIIKKMITANYPSIADAHKNSFIEIREFAKKYGYPAEMKAIRNTIVAHFDTDFNTYYDTLLKLNGEEGLNAVISFMTVLRNLQQFLGQFVSSANIQWTQNGIKQEQRMKTLITDIELMFAQHGNKNETLQEIKNRVRNVMDRLKGNLPDK